MVVVDEDGDFYRADPLVLHTWCAQCTFQLVVPERRPTTAAEVEAHWQLLLDELDVPSRTPYATTRGAATAHCLASVAPCAFCDNDLGFTTFCHTHTGGTADGRAAGCRECCDRDDPSRTSRAFHATCGARQTDRIRVVDRETAGVLCAQGRKKLRCDGNPARREYVAECRGFHRVLWDERPAAGLASSHCTAPPLAVAALRAEALAVVANQCSDSLEDEDGAEATATPLDDAPALAGPTSALAAMRAAPADLLASYAAMNEEEEDEDGAEATAMPPDDAPALAGPTSALTAMRAAPADLLASYAAMNEEEDEDAENSRSEGEDLNKDRVAPSAFAGHPPLASRPKVAATTRSRPVHRAQRRTRHPVRRDADVPWALIDDAAETWFL
jgi:hypothetical protein